MTAGKTYSIPEKIKESTHITPEKYQQMYQASVEDPSAFWAEQADFLDWYTNPLKSQNTTFSKDEVSIKWFEDGVLNASYNCIDRHLANDGKKTALFWEGDNPQDSEEVSYQQLHYEVCKLANGLKKLGVEKGDTVAIYMPMVPQAAYAMLACARIGAVHSVIFGGFSPNAIADRINDSSAKVVITCDEGRRGGRSVPLKQNVDKAVSNNACPSVTKVIVHQLTHGDVAWNDDLDIAWEALVDECSGQCEPEPMNAEDPLFILYTSGSTGTPKGVVHTTGGYLLYSALTFKYVFDYKPDDIYWCSADVGWVTGHSYMIYGPLANGASQVFFEGVPTYPDVRRIAQVIELDFIVTGGGDERVSNSYTPRIRHAYIEYKDWLIGQTWTTFMDVKTLPESLDFVGVPDGVIFGRQTMLRYSKGGFKIALENPESTISTDNVGSKEVADDNALPDLTASYSINDDWGHVKVAGLVRQLSYDNGIDVDEDEVGYGVALSGKLKFANGDDVRMSFNAGSGLGRYMAINAATGVAVNPDKNNQLEAIESYGYAISYRHLWSDKARTSVMFSALEVDNPAALTGLLATKSTYSTRINYLYSPVPALTVGAEYAFAKREIESGSDGDMNRVQFSAKYAF